jgi:hypothetical protein
MFSIYRSEASVSPLRAAWETADEAIRTAILKASRRIDEQLVKDPQLQGESRDERTRILFRSPVAVLFEVHEDKKLVRIVRAWLYRKTTDGHDGNA